MSRSSEFANHTRWRLITTHNLILHTLILLIANNLTVKFRWWQTLENCDAFMSLLASSIYKVSVKNTRTQTECLSESDVEILGHLQTWPSPLGYEKKMTLSRLTHFKHSIISLNINMLNLYFHRFPSPYVILATYSSQNTCITRMYIT